LPTPNEILSGLGDIANNWRGLAIFWYVYAVAVLALILTRCVSTRVIAVALVTPLLSVSVLAGLTGNGFNSAISAVLAGYLAIVALGSPPPATQRMSVRKIVTAAALFVFGLIYPHFVQTPSFLTYIYEAPTGLIPCPTLSILVGLTIASGCVAWRAWTWGVGGIAGFYGIFGTIVLGVRIDALLTAGAILLLVIAHQTHSSARNSKSFLQL